jgi:hypothetical protein
MSRLDSSPAGIEQIASGIKPWMRWADEFHAFLRAARIAG